MTNNQHEQLPELLRLADLYELERDPESLYRLAAAELRRLHSYYQELESDRVTIPTGATSNAHWNQAPCAHCGCTEGQHFNAQTIPGMQWQCGPQASGFTPETDNQPAQVLDYPPLPDFDTVEQHIYGACRRYIAQDMLEPIHTLIRDAIDADRAARTTADRQPEPVSSDTLYLLRRLLSNQHTLTSAEFREELTKIVGEATQAEVL